MRQPVWIQSATVLAVHKRQLAEHGGLDGVRDLGLLESALMRPRNLWAYSDQKPDLPTLGAAYAYGITKNHPFFDGNKRCAYVVCRAFLIRNGLDVQATQEEKYVTFLQLAEGRLSEEELATWIRVRSNAMPRPPQEGHSRKRKQ